MAISFYVGLLLPFLAPVVAFRALVYYPMQNHSFPIFYLIGLVLMGLVYGLYYRIYVKDQRWLYGVLYASFSTILLIWQLPYAMATLKDTRWGSR